MEFISGMPNAHNEKLRAYQKGIELIEQKYSDLFKDRINPITRKKPDRLSSNCWLMFNEHTVKFPKDTYIPEEVQKEVLECFHSNFSVE